MIDNKSKDLNWIHENVEKSFIYYHLNIGPLRMNNDKVLDKQENQTNLSVSL